MKKNNKYYQSLFNTLQLNKKLLKENMQFEELKKRMKEVEKIVEREKPKKIKKEFILGFYNYVCPSCDKVLTNEIETKINNKMEIYGKFNYCPFCGQAILFEDDSSV